MMALRTQFLPLLFFLSATTAGFAQDPGPTPSPRGPLAHSWEDAEKRLKPFQGSPAENRVDPSTLDGKVVTGYQGWFFAEGDGSGRGWVHYGSGSFKPGSATVDMWPDMTEADPDERYPTEFRHQDGSVATVFSSYNPKTVNRHFQWMKEYGIDGAFLQRFATAVRNPENYDAVNAVMDNVRSAANANGRTWAVMYDLSSLKAGEIESLVMKDWKNLIDKARVTSDASYQHHRGKPVVTLWGIGFNDGREYTLEECGRLIDFLKSDPKYGGNTVMLGVPYYWRDQTGDADASPALHALLRKADIISPWSIGRYRALPEFNEKITNIVAPDLVWCQENRLDYMPVIFPGFQWKNLMIKRHQNPESNLIPRNGGDFFWKQGAAQIKTGARMLYLAMFDEIDEGTALFKVSDHPPVGESTFGTFEKNPPDHYLWLSGQLGKSLKESKIPSPEQPIR